MNQYQLTILSLKLYHQSQLHPPDQSEIEDLLQDLMTVFQLMKLQSFRRERCSNLTCKDKHLLSSTRNTHCAERLAQ